MTYSEVLPGNADVWLGADVSKCSFDVGLVYSGQHFPATPLREIPAKSFPRTASGAKACIAWAREKAGDEARLRLVMEATGAYSAQLAKWLEEAYPAIGAAIVNPARTKWFIDSLGLRTKTDRCDARALAVYGIERQPAAYEVPEPARAQLRSLSRYRDALVREKVAGGNRSDTEADNALVRKLQRQRMQQTLRQIGKVEAEMKALIKRTPQFRRDYALLDSIPGVAFVTAAMILAEIGDLRRFSRARQLSAFIGLNPRHHLSGTSVQGRPRLSKHGNTRVRAGLYMAAQAGVRRPGKLQDDYRRLIASGKAPKAALGAIMRKQLVIMRALLIQDLPYDEEGAKTAKRAQQKTVENLGDTIGKR